MRGKLADVNIRKRRSTILAVIVGDEVIGEQGVRRYARLGVEAVVLAAVALLVTAPFHGTEGGAIALFLTAAGLSSRFDSLLHENYRLHGDGARALDLTVDRRSASSLLAIFLGVFVAFVVAALLFGNAGVESRFGFLLELTVPKEHSIVTQSFGPPLPLIGHNLLVLGSAVILGLVYRDFGALLVIVWNAASWGLMLTLLVLRAAQTGDHHPAVLVLASFVAVLPHLVLEALAYVTAGLAAVFGSLLLTNDDIRALAGRVTRSSAVMLATSIVFLVAAALLESYWTPLVLDTVRTG
jgi:uncharacterized membrane protein SpoIIM required for sporulation